MGGVVCVGGWVSSVCLGGWVGGVVCVGGWVSSVCLGRSVVCVWVGGWGE